LRPLPPAATLSPAPTAMPNRPTYPRIALPPALALRVDALRAGAPTGRPSRQAVVERALALGLGVLEAPLTTMGEHHAREAFGALVADLEALAGALGGAYWEALRLARRRAGEAVRGREDAGWASGAPSGQRGPSVLGLTAEQADALTAENDRRWPGDRGAVG